ncbi:hypothetical protein, partial [Liquorilactobacillus sicerae]|uniref:hypothetical protein n=1 Tax=Liquorilactobacillus sicerae TaxID=1416943 RepID=UPI00247FFE30
MGSRHERGRLTVLIIDDTLDTQRTSDINSFANVNFPLILLKVRSGVKLDQCVLELLNLGIVDIITNLKMSHATYITEMLRSYRAVSGLSIDYNSYLRFSPVLFASCHVNSYRELIGENTRKVVRLVNSVSHSRFEIGYNTGWPFFYLTPSSENVDIRGWTEGLLNHINHLGGYLPFG